MRVIRAIKDIGPLPQCALTIGNFDGIHKGHQVLIKKTVDFAKENGIKSAAFTFANHPKNYFDPGSVKNIFGEEEKIELMEKFGIDYLINIPFEKFMTRVSPKTFVEDVLVNKIHVKKITVGHDFTFGRQKEGDTDTLSDLGKKYGFEVEVIEPIKEDNKRISSTYIRGLIEDGNMKDIPRYLGRNYSVKGEVIHGRANGRKIGFPTANIKLDQELVIPRRGIYASIIHIENKHYFGATNVGYNPTVNGRSLSVETHIIDFNKEIYGKRVKVEFLERIRDEVKFKSMEELKQQLCRDVSFVRANYMSEE